MNWFYSNNGQPAGPIPEEMLLNLLATGVITGSTLVWKEGMDTWRPASEVLGDARPTASAPFPAPSPAAPAATLPTSGDIAAGPAPTHLVGAILTTLCCCQPFGIVAIVFAGMTSGANSAGDYIRAADYSRKAAMWTWIAFGVGFVFSGIAFAMQFALGAAGALSKM